MNEVKILTLQDLEDIIVFEKSRQTGAEFEREMESWHARWRKESLEHYLPLGWSFCQRQQGKITAYILCQPLLFFEGWTQSLWIEHVSGTTQEEVLSMIEVAYRWARDKHLQKVFFNTKLKDVQEVRFAQKQDSIELGSFSSTKV